MSRRLDEVTRERSEIVRQHCERVRFLDSDFVEIQRAIDLQLDTVHACRWCASTLDYGPACIGIIDGYGVAERTQRLDDQLRHVRSAAFSADIRDHEVRSLCSGAIRRHRVPD